MSETSDRPSDSSPSEEVTTRIITDGVSVRKAARPHGSDAVAVYLTIQSIREDSCTVRIADAIPEPLRGNQVEFHPRYDPVNWTRVDGSVVYAATLAPDANRTTVYGILVDDPGAVERFSAEPAVEVFDDENTASFDATGSGDADGPFDFNPGDKPSEGAGATADGAPAGDVTTRQRAEADSARPSLERDGTARPGRDAETPDPVESLVAAVRRRDLTDAERLALRNALGVDGSEPPDGRLESLGEAVETLRDEVASTDRQAADVDRLERRLESLSNEFEERFESLSADLDALHETIEREVRWRSQLQRSIGFDPEQE